MKQWKKERRVKNETGKTKWVEAKAVVILDDNNEANGYVGITEDIKTPTSSEDTQTPKTEPEQIADSKETPEPNSNLTIISNYKNEGATVEIRNGTWTNGYAGSEKKKLEERGFDVIGAINADTHDYQKTIIYDLSGEKYPETATELFKIYDTRPQDGSILINSNADFVIILGTN